MEAVAKARAARASAAQGGAPPKTTLRKEKKKEKSKFAGSGTHIKPFASPTERPAKKIRPVTPAAQPIANDQDGESTVSESVELNLTFHPLPQLYRTTADLHPDIAFEDIDISNLTFDSSFEEDKENMGTTKPQLQDYKAVVNENKKLKKQVTNLKGKLRDEMATMTETLGNQGRELQALQASNENLKSHFRNVAVVICEAVIIEDGKSNGPVTVNLLEGNLPFVMALLPVHGYHGIQGCPICKTKLFGIFYGLLQMVVAIHQ